LDTQTKFVILAGPRTGSTYLVDYLDALPDTRCHSELFQDGRIDFRHHPPADPRLGDIAFRDAQPVAFLDLAAEEAKDCQRFGFKLIGSHIAQRGPDFIRHVCVDRGWKKIYLWRNDLFEQSVSCLLAARHFGGGIWERTPEQRRIALAPKELMACLHMVQTTYFVIEAALVNAHGDDVFSLAYDDLGRSAVMHDLLRFVGLSESAIERSVGSAGENRGLNFRPGPKLAARVENHAEIRRFFLKTRYRHLIE
jgi:LPS sulfotransferase NodH